MKKVCHPAEQFLNIPAGFPSYILLCTEAYAYTTGASGSRAWERWS